MLTILHGSTDARMKREKTLAVILIGIVVFFAVCNVSRIVINCYEVRIKYITYNCTLK